MSHDALCEHETYGEPCDCDLIAKVEARGIQRAIDAASWWMSPKHIADMRDLLAGGTGHASRQTPDAATKPVDGAG